MCVPAGQYSVASHESRCKIANCAVFVCFTYREDCVFAFFIPPRHFHYSNIFNEGGASRPLAPRSIYEKLGKRDMFLMCTCTGLNHITYVGDRQS